MKTQMNYLLNARKKQIEIRFELVKQIFCFSDSIA